MQRSSVVILRDFEQQREKGAAPFCYVGIVHFYMSFLKDIFVFGRRSTMSTWKWVCIHVIRDYQPKHLAWIFAFVLSFSIISAISISAICWIKGTGAASSTSTCSSSPWGHVDVVVDGVHVDVPPPVSGYPRQRWGWAPLLNVATTILLHRHRQFCSSVVVVICHFLLLRARYQVLSVFVWSLEYVEGW
jgi:hypothetical protein